VTLLEALMIGAIRGVTEVLPLGAAGHLALLPEPAASPDQMAATALATDIGIILALGLYFWRDLAAMAAGLRRLAKGRPDANSLLLLHVLEGTAAAAALGWGLRLLLPLQSPGPVIVAGALAGFGLVLLVADRLGITVRRVAHMSHLGAILFGALQAVALIPGVSRTGIVVTALRLTGYERSEAARFSLLLALPPVLGAIGLSIWRLTRHGTILLSGDLILTVAVAGLAALAAIALMMAWLRHATYTPFALWRIALGGGVLILLAVKF
jgi:undecaprenyl-diphosphatase